MRDAAMTIEVPGGTVESWSTGDGPGTPLLLLHGGPGGSSAGLMLFERLADDRRVVRWDQLGSPSSSWSGDARDLWTLDRFCDEVDAVRAAHDLDRVVLLGHSWGGWLSIDYASRAFGADGASSDGAGLDGLVLADTTASFASFEASIRRRVATLSPGSRAAVADADRRAVEGAGGVYDDEDYRDAALEFYGRFVVGRVPDPDAPATVFDRQRATEVFRHMQGEDELHTNGSLRTWDRRASLGAIGVPALVYGGADDHMDPECVAETVLGLADATPKVFRASSHCPHLEEPEAVLTVVRAWLDERGL